MIFIAYALMPGTLKPSTVTLLVFSLTIVAFCLLVVYQVRSIVKAPYPRMRAIEVVATVVPLFVVVFSITYLAMSNSDPATFNMHLDHVRAVYFTVVVFSTVGFGDIVAKTDAARLLVTVQIVLDLVLIGVVARLILGAVQRSLQRRETQ